MQSQALCIFTQSFRHHSPFLYKLSLIAFLSHFSFLLCTACQSSSTGLAQEKKRTATSYLRDKKAKNSLSLILRSLSLSLTGRNKSQQDQKCYPWTSSNWEEQFPLLWVEQSRSTVLSNHDQKSAHSCIIVPSTGAHIVRLLLWLKHKPNVRTGFLGNTIPYNRQM